LLGESGELSGPDQGLQSHGAAHGVVSRQHPIRQEIAAGPRLRQRGSGDQDNELQHAPHT